MAVPSPDLDDQLVWRRASACDANGCIEVAINGSEVRVRDSKLTDSPVLVYDADEWRTFVTGIKAGEFDL